MKYNWLLPVLMLCQVSYAQTGKKDITFDDLYKKGTFAVKSVPGFNGMKDGEHYTKMETLTSGAQQIKKFHLTKASDSAILFDNTKTEYVGEVITTEEYNFSKDEQKLLLKTDGESIYRHSRTYRVFVYDIKKNELKELDNEHVLHATFSPDGKKVAFVKKNNLYVKDLESDVTTAITSDGEWNKIINGNCDWVYEEEFAFTKAFDWSPDGKYIAYYRFDESAVPEYSMPVYGGLYPKNNNFKYPKAGEVNSIIQIKLYDVADKKTVKADIGPIEDQYIPRIKWTKDANTLCIYRLNRYQNELELLFTNAATGKSEVVYFDNNKYYISINDEIAFLPDNSSFIFVSEREGYNNLYRWDWKAKKLTNLTPGKYDVANLVGVDEKRKLAYYTAAENSPMERKMYSVSWDGKDKKVLTPEDGTHAITSIEGFNYFLDKHSRLNTPPVFYLRDAKGKIIRTLEDNKVLKARMDEFNLGKMEMKEITLPDGRSFNTWMITPPGFDANKRYPVLMYQYSGPGSQEVADRFPVRDYFWHHMMAQKGYIVLCADGTGTGFRGEEFKKKTYLQLGKMESDDQISIARYMAGQSYVDKERIGIWGWSYGGFMSATCIFKASDVFKAAIAVAPVTSWRYYDNIYTERYMRTPKENPKGYDDNAPEKMAKGLGANSKFLLIHGTGDDNVHFQNSVMLTDALINANKEFDSEYYPNRAHGISGGNARPHLYKRMTDFILSNL